MPRIIVSEFVTLDGVMEAPGGEPGHPHTGWVIPHMGPDQLAYKLAETLEAGSLLIGRVTYESFAGAWPHRDGEFADKMNAMPKHVVSTTLKDPDWNNTAVIADDVAATIERLKTDDESSGPILVAGSRTLVHFLIEHDLVDEFRLMVFPVVLGSGRKLFPETPKMTPLALIEVKAFPTGVVVQTYARAAQVPEADLSMSALCADPVKD